MRTVIPALLAMFFLSGCYLLQKEKEFTLPPDTVTLEPIEVPSEPAAKPYRATEAKVNNLIHTRLDVRPAWDRMELDGIAQLTFQPYFYPTKRLILDAKGMAIHEVSLVTDTARIPLDYAYDSLFLDIALNREFTRFEQYEVYIDYTAKPEELENIGSDAITGDKGLYFIDADGSDPEKPTQVWTQGQTEASSCWFPTIDQPNERTTQEIFITVEDNFKTLSNGELVYSNFNADDTRTDYWKQDLSHPPYLFMMAIGEFVIAQDRWEDRQGNEIMVNYYVEPEYAPMAYKIFGNTPEMMSFYSELLDYDYPWPKYSQVVVRDYVSGAMENTTATIHGEFLNQTDREMLDVNHEDVIAHELFHHWFGDLVTCESWSNLPLNESFATYGEYLWDEHKNGMDQAEFGRWSTLEGYFGEARFKQVPLIRFEYDNKDDMFDAHSYNKGGCILHMLRQMVGDEAFFQSLNYYLKTNEFSDAEVHGLRQAFEKTTGMDLNWFFDQWFLGAGHPEVEINYTDSAGMVHVDIAQTQDFAGVPTFRIPLTIEVTTDDGQVDHQVVLDQKKHSFSLAYSGELNYVVVGADDGLVWKKQDNKPESWFLSQMNNSTRFSDRLEAIQFARDSAGSSVTPAIIERGLEDPFWYIQQRALNATTKHPKLSEMWKPQVLDALNSKKSRVRASALLAVAKNYGKEESDLLHAGLNDPSYLVNAYALRAITITDTIAGLAECKKLEGNDDPSVPSTILLLYAEHGGPAQHSFFIRKLEEQTGGSLYGTTQRYGQYLARQNLQVIEAGLDRIEDIARNGDPYWLKFAAYQTFGNIREALEEKSSAGDIDAGSALTALNARIKAIKRDETDTRITRSVGNGQ